MNPGSPCHVEPTGPFTPSLMSDTTSMTPLQRLHHALVHALRERDPAGLGRPFTVAEIYQDLVPYRTHRDLVGVEMNGDYEHLILRLLAGEEGLVSLESEHARREMERELARSNPNTGLFREYAAVDVQLVAEHIPPEDDADPDDAPAPGARPRPEHEVQTALTVTLDAAPSVDDLAPEAPADGDSGARPDAESSVSPPEAAPTQGTGAAPGDDGVCFWCRETLPVRDKMNFCPFCGTDMALIPCARCGATLEPGWRFCIECGTRHDDG